MKESRIYCGERGVEMIYIGYGIVWIVTSIIMLCVGFSIGADHEKHKYKQPFFVVPKKNRKKFEKFKKEFNSIPFEPIECRTELRGEGMVVKPHRTPQD